MRAGSLFSGVGGLDLGLSWAFELLLKGQVRELSSIQGVSCSDVSSGCC